GCVARSVPACSAFRRACGAFRRACGAIRPSVWRDSSQRVARSGPACDSASVGIAGNFCYSGTEATAKLVPMAEASESYLPRRADARLAEWPADSPALLAVGPRATGKTTTAARFAKTVLRLDQPRVAQAVAADPDAVLRGLDEPILIDEWQMAPSVLGA